MGGGDSQDIVQAIQIWPTKWYIHKPESVPENEKQKILWDSEI